MISFLTSPVGSFIIGAVLKLVNNWTAAKSEREMVKDARSAALLKAHHQMKMAIQKDPFSKMTRRWVFLTVVFTFCAILLMFAIDAAFLNGTPLDLSIPIDKKTGILSFLAGGTNKETLNLGMGYIFYYGLDLVFMIMGFYTMPSK